MPVGTELITIRTPAWMTTRKDPIHTTTATIAIKPECIDSRRHIIPRTLHTHITTANQTPLYPEHDSTEMPTIVNGTGSSAGGVSDPKCMICPGSVTPATVSPSSARIISALYGSLTKVQLPRVPVMLILVLVYSCFAPTVFHIQMSSAMVGWLCTLAALTASPSQPTLGVSSMHSGMAFGSVLPRPV